MQQIAFCNRLSELMNEGDVSQDKLAKAIGIARQTVAQYQSGKTQPTADKISGMADFFGVTTDYLLGRTDCKSPDIEEQAICKKTGLSPSAVRTLIDIQERDRFVINDDYLDERPVENWQFLALQEYISSIITIPSSADIAQLCCRRAALNVDLEHDYRLVPEVEQLKRKVIDTYPDAIRWFTTPNERILLYNAEITRGLEEITKSVSFQMIDQQAVKEYLIKVNENAET